MLTPSLLRKRLPTQTGSHLKAWCLLLNNGPTCESSGVVCKVEIPIFMSEPKPEEKAISDCGQNT